MSAACSTIWYVRYAVSISRAPLFGNLYMNVQTNTQFNRCKMLPLLLLLLVDAVLVISANKCFDDGDELRTALAGYIDGECGRGNLFSNCEVSET